MNTNRRIGLLAGVLGFALCVSLSGPLAQAQSVTIGAPLPEFRHRSNQDWLNSPPLSVKALRGSVVLVDFWARECWNCYRSFPWLNSVADRYRDRGLVVVGVHTPELDSERGRDGIVQSVHKYQLANPIMLDTDYSY